MNYLTINEETLTELQTFKTIEEMNEAIKEHKQANELTQTERDILDVISRYACKYKGVAYPSKNTLAEAVGKVRRTVIRACNRLEALGIIEQYPTKRIKGDRRQSSNIIVIKRASTQVTPECHSEETTAKANNSSNTYDTKPDKERIIHESIRNNTPAEIVDLLSPFFYGSELYKYVGIVFKAKYRPHAKVRIEAHLEAFRACIFDVIRRFKAGYIRSLDAYLFASIRALSRRLFVENMT